MLLPSVPRLSYPRLLIHTPQTPPQAHQSQTDLQELKDTMKDLMKQMGVILNLLTTLLAKLS